MHSVELIEAALRARARAYTPYSSYAVGAALLDKSGKIWTGCNIENAAYGPSNCAERTAFFKAISEGVQDFCAIAIVGGKAGEAPTSFAPPCGVCRQVMMEFCDPATFAIVVASAPDCYESYTLQELLPLGFGPTQLKGE